MPTGFIKKIAKEKDQDIGTAEKKWEEAKAIAKQHYSGDTIYPVATAIFKNMEHKK